MREIKFRGRDEQGRWHFGMLRQWRDQSFAIETTQGLAVDFVDPATVGQFTGLTDSEGREIYEGDLLAVSPPVYDECKDFKFPVIYHEGAFIVTGGVELSDFLTFGRVTVIGNIHDSPELLEADDARD